MLTLMLAATAAFAGPCPSPASYTTTDSVSLVAPAGATTLSLADVTYASPVAPRFAPSSGCPLEIVTDGLALEGIDPDEIDLRLQAALARYDAATLARGVVVPLPDLDPDILNQGMVTEVPGIDPDEIDVALAAGVDLALDGGVMTQRGTVTMSRYGRVVGTSGATTVWEPSRAILYTEGLEAETVHLYLKVAWALVDVVIDRPIAGATTTAVAIPSILRSPRRGLEPTAP